MQADGFHSLVDGVSNIVGLVGISLASQPADTDHPYGHAKYEAYASAAIGAMLVFAAYQVGSAAISELFRGGEPAQVNTISFAVMLVTMAVNISITVWERRVGRRVGSEILTADASHTLSDVFVSLGVIVGLVAVKLGYPAADPLIALAVSGAIIYTAWGVFKHANVTLSDAARIPSSEIADVCKGIDGVQGCHHIRTRGVETEVYVDLHVQVDAAKTVGQAHGIAEIVERAICKAFPQAVDVIVHVEPDDDYQADKTAQERDKGLV